MARRLRAFSLLAALALGAAACAGSGDGGGGSAFESELWPGEGVPRFAARSDHLVLHEEPDPSSPIVARQPVEPGGEIGYDRTLVRTVEEGLVVARQPGRLLGRPLGALDRLSDDRYYAADTAMREIPYREGDSFAYLQYRAEGTCLIRHDGTVFEIDGCPWEADPAAGGPFELARAPVNHWWIEVTDPGERPLGWLRVDEQAVEFLPRDF